MPNLNGTGPQGQGAKSGRRRGRCSDPKPVQSISAEKETGVTKEVLGVGRGERPRGGGQGNCYGGNKRKGQGRRSGN